MMNNNIKNIPLTFSNTPLQNLRNILFEVDTTFKAPVDKKSGLNLEWTLPSGEKAVSKLELQKIILELKTMPGQYLTRADIGQIFLSICKNSEQNVNLFSINRLKEIIKS